MKSNVIRSFLILATIMILYGCYAFVSSRQEDARKRESWKYCRGLDEPLDNPWNLSLMQIQATMSTWQGTFAELQVKDSQKEAYDRVARIKAEAQALQGRVESIRASEYLAELTRLRMAVKSVPRIGEAAFVENNPWSTSLSAYVWECRYDFLASVGFICALVAVLVHILVSGPLGEEASSGAGGGGGSCYGGGGASFCPMGPSSSTDTPIVYPLPFDADRQQSRNPPFGSF